METKGRLKISVDQAHLTATLVFKADSQGKVWNLPKIKNLLEEKGIVEGVSEEALTSAVEKLNYIHEETVSQVIAQGTPPRPPSSPEYSWKLQPVPEELQQDADWILEKASEPYITTKKQERVQVEKQVQKKSTLPFGKAKQETVKKWETRVTEEPVQVDPLVVETGWTEAEALIAEISNVEEGVLGRSVYGKPITVPETPADKPADKVYLGRGVKETAEALYATHSGFVRRGKNWVEVLPFQHHKWELTVSKDQASCLLQFSPGKKDARPPKAEQIVAAAKQKQFTDEELVSAQKITQMIAVSIQRQKTLKDVPITKDRDGWFKVEASSDHLKGFLSAEKGSGNGKPLVLKEIGAAIKKSGFKEMDFDKIKADLVAFYRSRQLKLEEYVLVEGKAPTRGSDRSLEFSCRFMSDKERELRQQDTLIQEVADETTAPPTSDLASKPAAESAAETSDEAGGSAADLIPSLKVYPLSVVTRMAYVKNGNIVAEITSTDVGEEGVDIYGKVLPGLPGNDPPMSLQENVLLKDDQLVAQETGILDVVDEEESVMLRVRPYREAKIEVGLARDKMFAYLSLEEARGFAPALTINKVSEKLEEHKVVKGIDSSALSDAILEAKQGQQVEKREIAAGNPPVESTNTGKIKFHVQLASGEQVKIDKTGQADFRSHDDITAVEEKQLIAEIPSAGAGMQAGWNVCGEEVQAKGREGVEIQVGDNIRREEKEDGTVLLYAEKSGELEYDGKSIGVHVHHRVKGNVDMRCGNIKFPGTVEISGNVQRGFFVMAGGDIVVAGTVEGALLSAGNSIKVGQGIIGGNKAVIRAKQDIEAMFVEEGTLLSVGDIRLRNNCLRCQVKCNGVLRLTTEKGSLIGGKTFSKHGLEVQNLGNDKGTHTVISFGQDYLVADQIEQHEKEIENLKQRVTTLDMEMKRHEEQGQRRQLEKVRQEKLKSLKMIEKRSMRLFTLRERYEQHFSSKIVIRGTLYPGVVIESHGRFYEASKPEKDINIEFNQKDGRIVVTPNEKKE
ncbi:MAG: flagellar assembly protein A [Spirochaetia bacterium]